ncbi:MAG: ATP-binding protein [Candidatus Cloacimonetes bacterium]|nr:ATP-binding protein [Candidatus Cloacimonadota bacterium]
MTETKNYILVLDIPKDHFDCVSSFCDSSKTSIMFVRTIAELISILNQSDISVVMIVFKDQDDAHYAGEVLDKFNEYTYIPRLIVSSQHSNNSDLFLLTLPIQIDRFKDFFESAIKEFNYYKNLSITIADKHSVVAKQSGKFRIQSIREARDLARALSHLCKDANRVAMGLTEIFVNSIEHGNLGLSFDDKTDLQAQDSLLLEIDYLLSLDENKNKFVDVSFEKFSDYVKFHVIDMGVGFDWKPFMQLDDSRIQASHGRGIAMANMLSFSEVNYIYPGNQVELIVRLD